jgi:hypothetical protein
MRKATVQLIEQVPSLRHSIGLQWRIFAQFGAIFIEDTGPFRF